MAANVMTRASVAKVEFSDPPREASDVVVTIVESVKLRKGTHPYTQLGRFVGHFSEGKFVVDEMFGAPLSPSRPTPIHIVAGEGTGRATFTGHAPPAREVVRHILTINVEAPGLKAFTGSHPMHVGVPGVALVFTENTDAALRGYSHPLAESLGAVRLTSTKKVVAGAWGFSKDASVVNQVKALFEATGQRAAEIQVVGHTNNGLDFSSPNESAVLKSCATPDVKIVWHGCYACNFFTAVRQKAFFGNLPLATVYGHRDIMVQAGMPWGFVRISSGGEDDLAAAVGEVTPLEYVQRWANNEPDEHLRKTLRADEAEADVKAVVRKELAKRGLSG